jgi:hypothetical protein
MAGQTRGVQGAPVAGQRLDQLTEQRCPGTPPGRPLLGGGDWSGSPAGPAATAVVTAPPWYRQFIGVIFSEILAEYRQSRGKLLPILHCIGSDG